MVHKCAELGQMKYSKSLHEPLPGTCNMPTCQHALLCMQTKQMAVGSAAVQARAKSALDTFRS